MLHQFSVNFLSQIPEDLTFNGYRTTATEAICILLYRMGSKCRSSIAALLKLEYLKMPYVLIPLSVCIVQ